MFKVISFEGINPELISVCHQIRQAVFVEEQGIDENLEIDDKDEEAKHYLLFENETAVGTGRWRKTQHGIKLERYAVLPSWRNKGVGKKILEAMLQDVLALKEPIYLNAQHTAVNFYLQNGFSLQGDPFYEAEILHFKMTYPTPYHS